ncbi:MAG TPA: 8-amino-7-oxononanoate synthase [Candidatus Acidoferrales bacterium]|nr:8-amino-7-oxononanoate synthase [Candidatus Acidoferrales bacterium]
MHADFILKELRALREAGLYRSLKRVQGEQGPTLMIEGRELLNFCSNNYLGLAGHPALCAAAKEAIDRYGCGSGASRLISGNLELHEQLEEKIAALKGTEAALVFNSGYQANTGLLSCLAGEGDTIFSDALNHASIIDGCRLTRARVVVYPHGDIARLEDELKKTTTGKKLIVTETIFSMDGDEAPLAEIVELAERFGALVMVDEAHATGVAGPNGAGVVAKLGLGERILVQMGTLGKALGSFGAYVAGSKALRELIINRCRTFIFTTSLPPSVLAASIAAIELVRKEPERRLALWHNVRALRDGLKRMGLRLSESQSQIQPVIIGDARRCMALSARLFEKGLFCQGIRPPTVPAGTSRLRVTVMATHSHEHLRQAFKIFAEALNESRD